MKLIALTWRMGFMLLALVQASAFAQLPFPPKRGYGYFVHRLGEKLPAERVLLRLRSGRKLRLFFKSGERDARIVTPILSARDLHDPVARSIPRSPQIESVPVKVQIVYYPLLQSIPQDGNEPALSIVLSPPSSFALFASTKPSAVQMRAYHFNLRRFLSEQPNGRKLYAVVQELPSNGEYDPLTFPGSVAAGVEKSASGVSDSAFLVTANADNTSGSFQVTFNEDCAGRTYIFYYVWVNNGVILKQRGSKVGRVEFGSVGS